MKNNKSEILEFAIQVIEKEKQALEQLSVSINDSFYDVVNIIHNGKGRLIVSGIGKSANIAQKFCATLNSTGTPSMFMHSADAVHGDLGMVQENDIVLIISKSGNTPEVKRLAPFIKKRKNPLVVMVANMNSYLAHVADYVIYTPVESEAGPNKLAPTTSTTVQLVMCDAIAMTLASLNNFSQEDFAKCHPGGSLGKKLFMSVEDVFDKDNKPFVSEKASIPKTILNISSHRLGATVVLDENNQIKGIITDGDVRRMVGRMEDIKTLRASDIMSPNPKTISVSCLAVEALALMEENKITSVVVLENNEFAGLIHIHDIMREGIQNE
ncbi:MAG: KpsF/GutQ family sugar-phosphate isomerase [Bacteroidales bacterium]